MKDTPIEEPKYFIVRSGDSEFRMFFLKRDWEILHGDSRVIKSCRDFVAATRAHEGFSVKKGASSQIVHRVSYYEFMTCLANLKNEVANRESNISFDYLLSLPKRSSAKKKSLGGFFYLGYIAKACARFSGFCVLNLYEKGDVTSMRPVGFIDISSKDVMETDDGALKIHRVKMRSILLESLIGAFDFLQNHLSDELEIEFLE